MRTKPVFLVSLFVLLAVALGGVAVAQDEPRSVRGEPSLNVYAPEPTLTPGTTAQVSLQLENDGTVRRGAIEQRDMVTTARAVRVDVRANRAPFTVETQRQSAGAIRDTEVRDVPVTLGVPADAEPGEYEIEVRLRYSYTSQYVPQVGIVQEQTRTVTRTVDVEVDDRPRFELSSTDTDVQVGDSGTVNVDVTNVGGEPAREVAVRLQSTSPNVGLGSNASDTTRVDRLDPGENVTLAYDVDVRDGATVRNYSLDGTISFTDPDGVHHTDTDPSVGFRPLDEQTFEVAIDESTLRVGESGAIVGTVRNDGPTAVEEAAITLEGEHVQPRSPTYAIGDLDVDETAEFRFRATVPGEADAVPQRLDVTTRYRSLAGNDRATTDRVRVPVAERRDAIAVRGVDARFAAGESGTLRLEVTNQRDVDVRDVRLRLAVDDPLESDFRSTVVSRLEPGETDHVAFDLEIDRDAPVSQYPATVEIEYTDPDDEAVTVRPATVAVEVTEADGDLPAIEIVIFALLVVLVAAVFVWLYRR